MCKLSQYKVILQSQVITSESGDNEQQRNYIVKFKVRNYNVVLERRGNYSLWKLPQIIGRTL